MVIIKSDFLTTPPPPTPCSVPKWKQANESTRGSFRWTWNSSSGWLLDIFFILVITRAVKKTPCLIVDIFWNYGINSIWRIPQYQVVPGSCKQCYPRHPPKISPFRNFSFKTPLRINISRGKYNFQCICYMGHSNCLESLYDKSVHLALFSIRICAYLPLLRTARSDQCLCYKHL